MENPSKKNKTEQIEKAMDIIRNKHGPETITFAALVRKGKP
jgi:precorrin-3B methylase